MHGLGALVYIKNNIVQSAYLSRLMIVNFAGWSSASNPVPWGSLNLLDHRYWPRPFLTTLNLPDLRWSPGLSSQPCLTCLSSATFNFRANFLPLSSVWISTPYSPITALGLPWLHPNLCFIPSRVVTDRTTNGDFGFSHNICTTLRPNLPDSTSAVFGPEV